MSSAEAHIRHATNLDVEGVVRVIKAVYDEYSFTWDPPGYHADLYDLERAYFALGDTFFVAEIKGRIAATAALEFFNLIPGTPGRVVNHGGYLRVAGTDCSIERLYVHPDCRRRGLGRRLFERVVEDARNAGRTGMEIWSDKRFGPAHQLYQAMGAIVAGDRICDDPDVSPEWGLYLALV